MASPAPERELKAKLPRRLKTPRGTGVNVREVAALSAVPPDRRAALEALAAARSFRKQLEQRHGKLDDSTPLIREDRDR